MTSPNEKLEAAAEVHETNITYAGTMSYYTRDDILQAFKAGAQWALSCQKRDESADDSYRKRAENTSPNSAESAENRNSFQTKQADCHAIETAGNQESPPSIVPPESEVKKMVLTPRFTDGRFDGYDVVSGDVYLDNFGWHYTVYYKGEYDPEYEAKWETPPQVLPDVEYVKDFVYSAMHILGSVPANCRDNETLQKATRNALEYTNLAWLALNPTKAASHLQTKPLSTKDAE